MSGISVRVLADSISPSGKRITTFSLRYARFIHSEVLTHRSFSRNSSSSRAIPIKKNIKQVWTEPVKPIYWGKAQPGMLVTEELGPVRRFLCKSIWWLASKLACCIAKCFEVLGLAKSFSNRILEPFIYISTIITATEWDNMYSLRVASDSQPEFLQLAKLMLEAQNNSTPELLNIGEWHLPYITKEEKEIFKTEELIKMSMARCARVSTLNHDGTIPNIWADVKLADRLIKDGHMSPSEHVCTPLDIPTERSANLIGWKSYRTTLPNECRSNYPGLLKK